MEEQRFYFKDVLFIVLGSCIYAFGLVTFNIANDLAEGGVTGITLILRALFHFNPAYTTLLINIPLLLIGGKILGKRSLYYTLIGTVSLSVFLWFWQKFPVEINLDHDLLIVASLSWFGRRIREWPCLPRRRNHWWDRRHCPHFRKILWD